MLPAERKSRTVASQQSSESRSILVKWWQPGNGKIKCVVQDFIFSALESVVTCSIRTTSQKKQVGTFDYYLFFSIYLKEKQFKDNIFVLIPHKHHWFLNIHAHYEFDTSDVFHRWTGSLVTGDGIHLKPRHPWYLAHIMGETPGASCQLTDSGFRGNRMLILYLSVSHFIEWLTPLLYLAHLSLESASSVSVIIVLYYSR